MLTLDEADPWQRTLAQSFLHDFYHLPAYHRLSEERGEGRGRLYVYREGPYMIALPLLVRRIAEVRGLEWMGQGWYDATSVYGYAGPVASAAELPAPVVQRFQEALRGALLEEGIVSVFSRLHPLIPQQALLQGVGEVAPMGRTVSIDLTQLPEVQWASYRRNHRQDITHLRRRGATCGPDAGQEAVAQFVRVYHETMDRVNADRAYYFDRRYFEDLLAGLGDAMQLLVCRLGSDVVCGGLFSLCRGIAQLHLAGTGSEFLRLAPMKLLIDAGRLWAWERGARALHLGGGVGGREDSLFAFKAGFSQQRHGFSVWCWVLRPGVYARLVKERTRWADTYGPATPADYFPAYRAPAGAARAEEAAGAMRSAAAKKASQTADSRDVR